MFIRTARGKMKRMGKNGKLSMALYNPRDTLTCFAVSFVDDNAVHMRLELSDRVLEVMRLGCKIMFTSVISSILLCLPSFLKDVYYPYSPCKSLK